jgi:hypothetical protein
MLWSFSLVLGCTGKTEKEAKESSGEKPADDFIVIDEETPPEERQYLEAGRAFIVALRDQGYARAYDLLSSHAKARISVNQFDPPDDDAAAAKNEEKPLANVTREQFVELMQKMEQRYGKPHSINNLYVEETDPEILSGRGDNLSVMFAIGAMSESIPFDIRRVSLRGQVRTHFKPGQVEELAKQYEMSTQEIEQDEEFAPYFTIKYVLVEEDEQLKVGYFEFLPPSILD